MKISAFSFVRNAVKFEYPVIESIMSVLPHVDEFVMNLGDCNDGTKELLSTIKDPKFKIFESVWNPAFNYRSRILAMQTNLALYQCSGDWCFYIQADEVFPDEDAKLLRPILEKADKNPQIEGILFKYRHFFGGYYWVADSYRWYRREVRIIRNFRNITSYKDAQGFRQDGKKLKVLLSDMHIHHYGWVRPPAAMALKKNYHDSIHHQGKSEMDKDFHYENYIDPRALVKFTGHHPEVMKVKINSWSHEFNPQKSSFHPTMTDLRFRFINRLGKLTGWYPGEYRNYRLIKIK